MISTRSIDLLLRGVRASFAVTIDQAEKQLASYDSNVFLDAVNKTGALFEDVNASGQQRVEAISVTGVSELSPTDEAQEFPATDYVPSFVTSVEPYKFAKRIKVTRESAERRDTKYQKALNEAAKLQVAAANTQAHHKFDRFNYAFVSAASYKQLFDYGDSVFLCSASHPDKVGGTHSNLMTASDITSTNIELGILKMQAFVDDIGEPMPMGGGKKWLVVPKEKVKKAKENIASEWQVGTANNTVNVWYSEAWGLITSPFLSSTTAWFIVDGMFSPLKYVSFRPVTNETWFDENTKVFVHDISLEHKVGAYDYRGIIGNTGL